MRDSCKILEVKFLKGDGIRIQVLQTVVENPGASTIVGPAALAGQLLLSGNDRPISAVGSIVFSPCDSRETGEWFPDLYGKALLVLPF